MTRHLFAGALACLLLLSLSAPAVAEEPRDADGAAKVIIGFEGELPEEVAMLEAINGLEVVHLSSKGAYVALEVESPQTLEIAAASLPGVAYVENDETLYAQAIPNDARYNEQYGPAMMGAHAAWDAVGYGDNSVNVAVLDTGTRHGHQDLTPASRFSATEVYTGNSSDNCGHGTHVAGTIAATTDNGIGVAGLSQAHISTYKVLDATGGFLSVQCSGSTSSIAQAVYDATDDGADIISMSLGGGGYSSTFENAINYAWANGVLVVVASGNDGASNGVSYPAAYDNSIAVGALDDDKGIASYSNQGDELDVVAPGSDVLSTYANSDSSYSSLSGTSMATPHVSGALALALSCAPAGTTNVAVRAAMESTAEDLGSAGRDNTYGHGLVRADLLVDALCDGSGGGGGPTNTAPTAAFTSSTDELTVDVDGTSSTDADGDALTHTWTFGDGATATGATASHTYAADGTYTVTLTVDDGNGGTDSVSSTVTVEANDPGGDPDPSTPNLTSGQTVQVSLSGSGDEAFYKIEVPAGANSVTVAMTGPSCGLFSCSIDADLYTRDGARPNDSAYDCRPFQSGSDETCTDTSPTAGWLYVRVDAYSGSGTVDLTATIS